MSAGGFWRRSRARQEYQDAETLTATDPYEQAADPHRSVTGAM